MGSVSLVYVLAFSWAAFIPVAATESYLPACGALIVMATMSLLTGVHAKMTTSIFLTLALRDPSGMTAMAELNTLG